MAVVMHETLLGSKSGIAPGSRLVRLTWWALLRVLRLPCCFQAARVSARRWGRRRSSSPRSLKS